MSNSRDPDKILYCEVTNISQHCVKVLFMGFLYKRAKTF